MYPVRQRLSSLSARRETRGNLKARESNIQQKASFEPSKLTDKNAIKCEIFDQADWLVIGHCGVEKIPNLQMPSRYAMLRECGLPYYLFLYATQTICKLLQNARLRAVSLLFGNPQRRT